MSCLVEQAKILVAEAEENNLDLEVKDARFQRWETCSLCEQRYHGVVQCALGWGCWKTYLGRPDREQPPPSGGPEVLQTADDLAAYFGGS